MKKEMYCNNIKVIICDTYDELSETAAEIVANEMKKKPEFVLGLATGSSPVGLYNKLSEKNKKGEINFEKVRSFNLDEYYPIAKSNNQSYDYFMKEQLFNHVNIDKKNTYVPNGMAEDIAKECADYDKFIESIGGIDLQLLGIGRNGHIAFNEPADAFTGESFKIALTQSTIDANSIYFDDIPMPRYAMTMGIGSIMKAKKIVLIATGSSKAEAVKGMIKGEVTPQLPASVLQNHEAVVIFLDEAAAALL